MHINIEEVHRYAGKGGITQWKFENNCKHKRPVGIDDVIETSSFVDRFF